MAVTRRFKRIELIPLNRTPSNFIYFSIQPNVLIVYRSRFDARAHLGRVAYVRHSPWGTILHCRVKRLFARVLPGQAMEEEIEQEQIERIVTSISR